MMGFIYSTVERKEGEIPIIAYGHTSILSARGAVLADAHEYFAIQKKAIRKDISEGRFGPKSPTHGIAVIWRDNKLEYFTDTFVLGNLSSWSLNPDVASRVFKIGSAVKNKGVIGCGDALIMLGIEEKTRRGAKGLEEYLEPEVRKYVQMQLSESGLWNPVVVKQ